MSIVNKQHAIERLEPAIAGLKGLTAESLQYDSELLEHCLALTLWLQSTLDRINGVEIEEPTSDIKVRSLVASVGIRTCSLLSEIEREIKLGQTMLGESEQKLVDLKFSGASKREIEELEADTQAKFEASRRKVIDLVAEKKRLDDFMESGPEYDFALLNPASFLQLQE